MFGFFNFFNKKPSKDTSSKNAKNLVSGAALSAYTTLSSEDGVLSITAAYRCIAVISETIAQLSGDIIQKQGDVRQIKNDHPQYYLLFNRPSRHVSSFVFRRQLIYNYLISGNGYAIIHRDEKYMPTSYELVQDLEIYLSEDKEYKYYYNKITGNLYESGDIIHLADIGPNELKGKSRITQHSETFGKAKASAKLSNKLYSNGLNLGGSVEFPKDVALTPTARDEYAQQIKDNYGGLDNAGKILVLDQGGVLKNHENLMSLQDAEYILGEHLSIEDVCRIFGVPPFKVFHFNKMTYDNMEAMKVDFVESCILPITTQYEQEINYKSFSLNEIKSGYLVKHNIKSLLRADIKAQAEYFKAMFGIGRFTINEMRAMDDVAPINGGDDAFIQVNNYMPLHMVQDYAAAMIEAKKNKGRDRKNDEEE